MNELIRISTNEQGSDVVSARELHTYLEAKTKFADWIKGRIIRYGFLESVDYVEVETYSENSEKLGRPETDYALTLDMAKELSMVERNDKGKQARQYFIEAEKALRQVVTQAVGPTIEQVQLQQAHMLIEQQQQINQLRADVEAITAQRRLPYPSEPKRPHLPRPQADLRRALNSKVNEYCGTHGYQQADTWNYLYKRMQQVYGIDVRRLGKSGGESYLDAVERYGHLDKLYSLVTAELNYIEE